MAHQIHITHSFKGNGRAHRFMLRHRRCGSVSVTCTFRGVPKEYPWHFNDANREVVFSGAPPKGAVINVTYFAEESNDGRN